MSKLTTIILYHQDIDLLYNTMDSLTSVKEQSPEIILVGDASLTIHEKAIKEKYLDFNIMLLPLPDNTSAAEKFNKGASASSGNFLVFLEAGTYVYLDSIYSMISVINGQATKTWCYGNANVTIDNEKNVMPPSSWTVYQKEGLIFPYQFPEQQINFQSMVIPRELFTESNGFSTDYRLLYGIEFALRMALFYRPAFLSQPICDIFENAMPLEIEIQEQLILLYEFLQPAEQMGLKKAYLNLVLNKIKKHNLWGVTNNLLDVLSKDKTCNQIIKDFLESTFVEQKIIPSKVPNVSGVLDCVGCGSCSHICPVNAISMEYNQEGFLYPQVNFDLCINCKQCLNHCPTQNKLASTPCQDKCLAITSLEYRQNSSSGGIFPLLGKFFLDAGGFVSGAIFDETLKKGIPHVHHIVSDDPLALEKMRSSKYVQSDTTKVYPKIKELLDNGKSVFFTGCACQVAGLKAYLKDDYPNLFTADVVCHGSPSPMVFENYIQELYTEHGEIEEIDFRKKDAFGWAPGLYVKFSSGHEISEINSYPYVHGFLTNWYLRKTCYDCQFKSRKYSDISLGDFWGINNLEKDVFDKNGTSFVELNSHKGIMLYQNVLGSLEKKLFMPTEYAIPPNICIRYSVSEPKFREHFFSSWYKNKTSLVKTIDHACDNVHFDVAMVLMWSVNHGNAITNYALYNTVKKYCSVMVIDNCSTLHPQERFRTFADNYYNCSSTYFPDNRLDLIMEHCDTLLTGSDQIWNYEFESLFFYGTYYQLDFAINNNTLRKIAYSSSFGDYKQVPPASTHLKYYEKFDRLSVRDIFGPKAFKDTYNLDAEFVLDPVFLLDQSEYDFLISNVPETTIETEPFIVSYVLTPTKEKREACKKIQKQLGNIKIINICEGDDGDNAASKYILEHDNIKLNVTVEDWLYYLKNAEFVITDSFHGTCFSVYFKKQFISFVNRQSDRFLWFKELGDPFDHIIDTITDENLARAMAPIDYAPVWDILEKERTRSLNWLKEALFCDISRK